MSKSANFNILNDFPPEKYNLLVPVQSIQDVNPIYRIVTNIVKISTNLEDNEIYEEKQAQKTNNQPMFALTHKGLLKLSTAANGQIVGREWPRPKACEKCIDMVKATGQAPSCGSCPCRANVACTVTMKFPELSGGWRIVQATREYDFSNVNGKAGQIARMKEFASEHVESKAISRCIRKALNIKNAYTFKELEKPFVVAYPVLDARDADVKKALITGAVAASNLLYGSGLELPNSKREELPSGIDPDTGEVLETDYEIEQLQEEVNNRNEKYFCTNPQCGVEIQENVAQYSIQTFGQPLCFKCQQLARKGGNHR